MKNTVLKRLFNLDFLVTKSAKVKPIKFNAISDKIVNFNVNKNELKNVASLKAEI